MGQNAPGLCSIEGCRGDAKKRGFCKRHYGKWYRREVVAKETRKCSIEGCDRPFTAKGLCDYHYRRKSRHGDPLVGEVRYRSVEEALAARTVRADSGCLEWVGASSPLGYGHMKINGRVTLAHRASYELRRGPIPEGMGVLHRCDNPACVDPDHLFLGTQQDNVDDMNAKGRGNKARGAGHASAKLTEDDVRAIRADPRGAIRIARDYPIGKSAVGYIKSGKTWKHVT